MQLQLKLGHAVFSMSLKDLIDGGTSHMNDYDQPMNSATPVNSHMINLHSSVLTAVSLCPGSLSPGKGECRRKNIYFHTSLFGNLGIDNSKML